MRCDDRVGTDREETARERRGDDATVADQETHERDICGSGQRRQDASDREGRVAAHDLCQKRHRSQQHGDPRRLDERKVTVGKTPVHQA